MLHAPSTSSRSQTRLQIDNRLCCRQCPKLCPRKLPSLSIPSSISRRTESKLSVERKFNVRRTSAEADPIRHSSCSPRKAGGEVMRERRSRRIASPLLAASLAIILAAVPCASFSPAASLMGNLKGLSVAHSSATRTSGRARGARRWRKGHGAAPGGEIRPSTADTTPACWGTCQWFAGRCHPCLSNQQEGKGENLDTPGIGPCPLCRRLCEHGTVRVG
jgi:hypothetical protein